MAVKFIIDYDIQDELSKMNLVGIPNTWMIHIRGITVHEFRNDFLISGTEMAPQNLNSLQYKYTSEKWAHTEDPLDISHDERTDVLLICMFTSSWRTLKKNYQNFILSLIQYLSGLSSLQRNASSITKFCEKNANHHFVSSKVLLTFDGFIFHFSNFRFRIQLSDKITIHSFEE